MKWLTTTSPILKKALNGNNQLRLLFIDTSNKDKN
jgi:hypothetical protein